MKKRGSHVGVMLSFAIFLTFLIFLFVALEPAITSGQNKKSVLNYLKIELPKMFNSSLTEINEVADRYNHDYEDLKTDLKISDRDEFAFIFTDSEGTEIIAEKDIPENINVYIKEVFVLYVDGGDSKAGFLTIKVW